MFNVVHQKFMTTLTSFVLLLFLAGVLYGILDNDFLPGSEIFALYLLATIAYFGGVLVNFVRFPALLGMLLVGMLFRNCAFIPFHKNISVHWSVIIRDCALAVILLKAGLGLDPEKLSKLKFAVFKLSVVPCLCETISSAIFSHYILQLPWLWSFMLGFILSAVSAAVLVPGMLDLDIKRFGVHKGIPTLLLASVSIDNIICLTGFFVTFSILTSEAEISIVTLIKRPLEPFLGLVVGGIFGVLMWWLPSKKKSSVYLTSTRSILLCLGGFCFTFLSKKVGMPGAGALGCVSFAFIASLEWRKEEASYKNIAHINGILWIILETFLFGLIGTQVTIRSLEKDFGKNIVTLSLGIVVRFLSTILSLFGSNMSLKEKTFISATWISKATVQAAVGSQALEYFKSSDENEIYGEKVLSMCILSIVLTAPLGAIIIEYLGPYLLKSEYISIEDNVPEKKRLLHITVTDFSSEIHPSAPELEFNN